MRSLGIRRTAANQIDQRQDRLFNNGLLKALNSTGLLLLDYTVNHIRAIANLPISRAGLGENLSRFHIHQKTGNRRCAYVYGQTAGRMSVCNGQQIENFNRMFALLADASQREVICPKQIRQLLQHQVGKRDIR